MSEERRKALRTQGRFSDDFKKKNHEKTKKTPPKEPDSSSIKSEKVAQSYVDILKEQPLKYTENSEYAQTFEQLSTKKEPLEIKSSGEVVLSESPNGISRIVYEKEFMEEDEATAWFLTLYDEIQFDERNIVIHGEEHPQPRLVAWYGPYPYTYSGLTLQPAEIPESVMKIKLKVEQYLRSCNLNVELNSVLLNLYEHGKHSIAWHSDDELTMGVQPTIASVSLGATRRFQMRKKPHLHGSEDGDIEADYFINLTNGSLLVMDGCMQKDWQHRVPKEFHDKDPRINLTFRTVYSLDELPAEIVPKTPDQIHESNESLMKKSESIPDNVWSRSKNPSTETNRHFKPDSIKKEADDLPSEQIELYDPSEFPLLNDSSKDSITPVRANKDDSDVNSPTEDADEETQYAIQDEPISANPVSEIVSNPSANDRNPIDGDDFSRLSEKPNPLEPCAPFSNRKVGSLNVNAPTFVPKTFPKSVPPAFSEKPFSGSGKVGERPMDEVPDRAGRQRLSNKLLDVLQYPIPELVHEYSFIIQEISNSLSCPVFSERDRQELEFLCEISNDQSAENQKRICIRIREVVLDAKAVQIEARRIRNSIEARSSKFRNSESRQPGPFRFNKSISPRHQQQRSDKRHEVVHKRQ